MKIQVQCQKESYFSKKNMCAYLLVFVLCIVLILPIVPSKDELKFLMILMITIYAITFLAFGLEKLSFEKLNYLILDEDIRFVVRTGTMREKTCQYSDVRAIFVDECPEEFIQPGILFNKGRSQLFWTASYGKYIIAVDKENNVLFVCSYSEDVWEMLIARCGDSLEYIFSEEEYADFKKERKKLMDQVEKETVQRELERYYGRK